MLYLLLAGALFPVLGWAAWALVVMAGVSRIVQSVYAESQRRTYLWWAYGVPWLRTGAGAGASGGAGAAGRLYVAISRGLSAGTGLVEPFVAAGDPRVASLALMEARRTLPLQVLLGANPRTVLLGLSMLAGSAAWFFLVEASALNLLLVVSILQQRRASARIAAALGGTASREPGSLQRQNEGDR